MDVLSISLQCTVGGTSLYSRQGAIQDLILTGHQVSQLAGAAPSRLPPTLCTTSSTGGKNTFLCFSTFDFIHVYQYQSVTCFFRFPQKNLVEKILFVEKIEPPLISYCFTLKHFHFAENGCQ